jgi:hypothetical protein
VREVVGRDIHRAHDPVPGARVEDVHARGRLLEVAEECALSGEREGEDRAVDAAMEDGEERVPAFVGEQPLERRQDAVEERADRLAAEEARLLGDDVAEDAGERLLDVFVRNVAEPAGPELAEIGPRLRLDPGRNDPRRLERALEVARDRSVESEAGQGFVHRPCLFLALAGERDGFGPHRPTVGLEIRDLRVAHEVDAPPHQG